LIRFLEYFLITYQTVEIWTWTQVITGEQKVQPSVSTVVGNMCFSFTITFLIGAYINPYFTVFCRQNNRIC